MSFTAIALLGMLLSMGGLLVAAAMGTICACRLKRLCKCGGGDTTKSDDLCGAMFTWLFASAVAIIAFGFFAYCYFGQPPPV
ncbi:hypothetical protein A2454_03885 [Candidatus Peribacteria bacterium RIFOXYC2_FULL_55_14]|nr:MAG: hypothetical protein UY85_C0044G0006 [Candidatus Peribacteria bacterium GW2011_GWB1_54_5]KKW39038.1 MAG: hypothetical protein UY87_C0055G0005 [Candidatus Peribacteria bacterium GW2011_GWC2_54_8]KKW40426.1 MAG: hypothetical protein UY90_C0082G0007 [Candidatus Peregrinibacteria bacterium GW2011_GWA2_54_9]OGJ71560.1 MAG: hypothetical protein A2198_05140 [Candidatus Peribacteria bacterium RIFOXYA1_FULL_56_14]OGJ72953.1 MAG: hypothetical protein A2217_06650 [Candidatus Peribacteria bacterium